MAGKKKGVICAGTVQSERIRETHQQVKAIAEAYKNVNWEVSEITNTVRENWVGMGRNEFESQYKLLIRKIEDFGDTLQDIYEGLVEAEAAYQTTDNEIKQSFSIAMGK